MEQTAEVGGANGTSHANEGASTDNLMPRFVFMPTPSSDTAPGPGGREDYEGTAQNRPSLPRSARFVPPPPEAPPPDALPEHGVAYFRQMLSEYETFPAGGDDPECCLHYNSQAFAAIDSLFVKPDPRLGWDDLDRLEMARLQVLPPATLRTQAWLIRERYAEAVGPEQFRRYQAARPADWSDAAVPPEALRADLETLLSETQKARILRPALAGVSRSVARSLARWTVGLCLAGILGFVVTRFLPLPPETAPIIPLLLAMLAGAVGGLVGLPAPSRAPTPGGFSLRNDPDGDLRHDIFLSPIKAAVFAAALYFLFLGGHVHGGIFPGVDPHSLAAPADFAGLMVWAFGTGLAVSVLPRVLPLTLLRKRREATGEII